MSIDSGIELKLVNWLVQQCPSTYVSRYGLAVGIR